MSLMWKLRKFIDPAEYEKEDEARRRQRELLEPEKTADGGEPPVKRIETTPRAFKCRVCGHRELDQQFCPKCLAGTMRPE